MARPSPPKRSAGSLPPAAAENADPGRSELRAHAVAQLSDAAATLSGAKAGEGLTPPPEHHVQQTEWELQQERLRRAHLELALAREEADNRFEDAFAGQLILRRDGSIVRANAAAAELLGVERAALPGARLTRFVTRAARGALREHIRNLAGTPRLHEVELQLQSTCGAGPRTVRVRSRLRADAAGGPARWEAALLEVAPGGKQVIGRAGTGAADEPDAPAGNSAVEEALLAAQQDRERLAGIIDAARDAVITVDAKFNLLLFNAAAAKMFGRTNAQVVGRPLDILIPSFRPQAVAERQAAADGAPGRRPEPLPPVRGIRADGTEFPVEASLSRSSAGGRDVYTLILRDISRRIRVMEIMIQNENALMDFFTAAPLGLMWVSSDGRIERVNRAQLELMGRTDHGILGRPVTEFHPDPAAVQDILDRVARAETVQNQRAQVSRADGTIRHVLVDANGRWKDGKLAHSRWFVRDITTRVDLEREILAVAERERERIGRELHDDLCQELLGIEFMSESAARRWEAVTPGAAQDYRVVSGSIRAAISHARELARGLSPPAVMVDRGLVPALQDLALRTQRVFQRKCTCRCPAPVVLHDESTAINLYRIAQEAVSNAIRHGQASRVEIALTATGRDLVLAIHDNGCGLPDTAGRSEGMGLHIMHYRAGVINGSLSVQRRPRGGTTVRCTAKDAIRPPPPATLSSPP